MADEWKTFRDDWYNDRIMETYISAPIVDKQNDLIPTKTMEESMDFFMKYGVYSFKHEEQPIGLPLAWKTENGKVKIKVGIHSGLEMHDHAWKEIKLYGTNGGSSIRGEATEQKQVCDGDKCHNQIDELGLWSVSWVEDHPANPEAEVTQVAAMAKSCGCGGCGCDKESENSETLKYNTEESDDKEDDPMTEEKAEPEVVAPEDTEEVKEEEVKEGETTKEEEEEEEEVEAEEEEEEEEEKTSKDISLVRDALLAALDYLEQDKQDEPEEEEEKSEPEEEPIKEKELTLEKAIKALKKNGYTVYSGSKNTPAPKKIETPKSTYKFEDLISKDWDELERIERGM